MTQLCVIAHTHGLVFKSLSVFLFLMFWAMISFGQNNYGTFELLSNGSYPNGNTNYSDHVMLGPFTGAPYFQTDVDPYARLSIYETTSGVKGLSIRTTSATALYAYSSSGLAALLDKTFFTANVGVGINPLTTAAHEQLAVRNGMITTSGIGNGISLNGSYYGSNNDFGTQHYGLFMGDGSLVNLSMAQNNGYKPMVLSNFYGLALNTYGGKMAMCQNGAVYIGGRDAATITTIEGLADKDEWQVEYRLYVEKGIRTEKVKVDAKSNWPDFVFEEDYNLPTLTQVESYIDQNKHLPNVPSAAEVEKDGIDLGEMDKILLQKIEELTLYTI